MLHPLHSQQMKSQKHQMFYDETNNFRKLVLNKNLGNLNTDRIEFNNTIFYLGGIAFANGYSKEVELKQTYEAFKQRVNRTKIELKFDDVAKNDFFSVLKSAHLKQYLKLLIEYNVCIHYQAIDMIYMIVTDLIDEHPIVKKFYELYPQYSYELMDSNICASFKDVLHSIFNENTIIFLEFINRTNFPYIHNSEIFVNQFIDFIKNLKTTDNQIKIQLILSVFERIENKADLFMDGYPAPDESLLLINSFSGCYYHRITTLSNCSHVFDEEEDIQESVLHSSHNTNTLIKFVDSLTDYRIQMSDILIGFVRKFVDYHLKESFDIIKDNFRKMNPFQKECLENYLKLEDLSNDVCEFFFLSVIPLSDKDKLYKAVNFYKQELGLALK